MKKICLNCASCKIQITDDGSDLDFSKPLVCTNNKFYLIDDFLVDIRGQNRDIKGKIVDDEDTCKNFKWNRARKNDLKAGC